MVVVVPSVVVMVVVVIGEVVVEVVNVVVKPVVVGMVEVVVVVVGGALHCLIEIRTSLGGLLSVVLITYKVTLSIVTGELVI